MYHLFVCLFKSMIFIQILHILFELLAKGGTVQGMIKGKDLVCYSTKWGVRSREMHNWFFAYVWHMLQPADNRSCGDGENGYEGVLQISKAAWAVPKWENQASRLFLLARYLQIRSAFNLKTWINFRVQTRVLLFVQVMKPSKGKANPALLNKILLEKLNTKE